VSIGQKYHSRRMQLGGNAQVVSFSPCATFAITIHRRLEPEAIFG
jgi:hypothetical protein